MSGHTHPAFGSGHTHAAFGREKTIETHHCRTKLMKEMIRENDKQQFGQCDFYIYLRSIDTKHCDKH